MRPEATQLWQSKGGVDEAHLDQGLGQGQSQGDPSVLLLFIGGCQLVHQGQDYQ